MAAALLRLATDDQLRSKLGAGAEQSTRRYAPDVLAQQWVEIFRVRAQPSGSRADGRLLRRLTVDSTTAQPGEEPTEAPPRDHAGDGPERGPGLGGPHCPQRQRLLVRRPAPRLDDVDGGRADAGAGRVPPRAGGGRRADVPLPRRRRWLRLAGATGTTGRARPRPPPRPDVGREPRTLAPDRREAEPARPGLPGGRRVLGGGRRRRPGRPRRPTPTCPASPPGPRPSTSRSKESPSGPFR